MNGKKVKIILKNGYHYTGNIIREDDKNIFLVDKFDLNISIDKSSISVMIEVRE